MNEDLTGCCVQGAVSNRVAALKAGLDLECGSSTENDQTIVDAVIGVDESVLDEAVARLLNSS